MSISQESVQINCADGVVLHGKLLIPQQPRAIVQFNAGTAAKKEFYLPFLSFLSENGYLCCLWDYRGSGESAPGSLRGCTYTFRDYGMKDMPAVKAFLQQRYPDLPLLLVGHSAGGQQVGMMPDLTGVKGLLGIAVSTGYAPGMPLGYRLQATFFFRLFSPLSIALSGYVAAKRFGIMEDLPKNVVREWRAWCSSPDYCFDPRFYGKTVPTGHYQAMPFPIHVCWAPDDTVATEANVKRFWSHVKSPYPIGFSRWEAAAYGQKSIGHFGFFRRKMQDSFWPDALARLDGFLADQG